MFLFKEIMNESVLLFLLDAVPLKVKTEKSLKTLYPKNETHYMCSKWIASRREEIRLQFSKAYKLFSNTNKNSIKSNNK